MKIFFVRRGCEVSRGVATGSRSGLWARFSVSEGQHTIPRQSPLLAAKVSARRACGGSVWVCFWISLCKLVIYLYFEKRPYLTSKAFLFAERVNIPCWLRRFFKKISAEKNGAARPRRHRRPPERDSLAGGVVRVLVWIAGLSRCRESRQVGNNPNTFRFMENWSFLVVLLSFMVKIKSIVYFLHLTC